MSFAQHWGELPYPTRLGLSKLCLGRVLRRAAFVRAAAVYQLYSFSPNIEESEVSCG